MKKLMTAFFFLAALSAVATTQAQIAIKLDITVAAAPCNGHTFEPSKAAVMDLYLYPLDKANGITPILLKDGKHDNIKAGRYLVSRQQLNHPDDLEFYRQWSSGKNDIEKVAIDTRMVNKKVISVGKDLKEQTFDYQYYQYCGW
jgi:hypothetical protein